MKKIKKNLDRDYGPVKLDSADLTEIFDSLSGREGLKLTVDDFEYDSVAEWVEHSKGKIPSKVQVSCNSPYTFINFTRTFTNLSIWRNDLEAHGFFNKLNDVLTRCQRRPKLLYHPFVWSMLMGSVWPLLVHPYQNNSLTEFSIFGAWLLLFLWTTYIAFRRHSLVIPSAARPGAFWRRNSDDIWKLVIGAIIGAIAAFAGTVATEQFRAEHAKATPSVSASASSAPTK